MAVHYMTSQSNGAKSISRAYSGRGGLKTNDKSAAEWLTKVSTCLPRRGC
jgi:hypothetical protein